jgi:hypothetical protein
MGALGAQGRRESEKGTETHVIGALSEAGFSFSTDFKASSFGGGTSLFKAPNFFRCGCSAPVT